MRTHLKYWLFTCALGIFGAQVAGAAPLVPGFTVEHYADVTDPVDLAFDPSGVLYVGRDATGSGGTEEEAVKIHRVGPGGGPVTEFGDTAIPDPDAVLFDVDGTVSGVPGSVLVGGYDGGEGALRAIHPDQTVSTLFHLGSGIANPNTLKFDSTGRVVMADNRGPVAFSTGGNPTVLFNVGVFNGVLAIDTNDDLYTGGTDGVIRVHAADGTLLNSNFYTDPNPGPGSFQLEFGPGFGPFGDSLYAISRDSGELIRFDDLGNPTVIGTGFGGASDDRVSDIAFGPDGALYASIFDQDRVIRVVPEPGSLVLLGLGAGALFLVRRRR